jgi:uncharacterized Rmd1/YagE family protein
MATAIFKAAALTNEINVNRIAAHFGFNRKVKWEEAFRLGEAALQGVLREPDGKAVYIFPFGSMVFANCAHHEIMDIIRYLAQVEKNLAAVSSLEYTDDYEIRAERDEDPAISNDYLVTPAEESYHREIVATVLAKSVALERIERDTDVLLDEIEDIVGYLQQGKLNISDEQLGKMSARILGFKLSTISYIMLLDKPDITWVNEEAAALYDELGTLFELNDRYENIKHKTETLMDITEVFAGLTHARRGTRLEWAIIVLIGIEIVLSLVDMAMK